MLKPDSLRARLTDAFPDEFLRDTTRLSLWIEKGFVQCNAAPDNLNFTVAYTLCVSLTGWRLPSVLVWITVIDWLRIQQPDLLARPNSETGIPFEADLLSKVEVDLGFDLMLTEPVRVTIREDGGFDMEIVPEPDPLFDDAVTIPPGPLLKQIWSHGEHLVLIEEALEE